MLVIRNTMVEIVFSDQRFQCKVGLDGCTWRANANYLRFFQRFFDFFEHFITADYFTIQHGLTNTIGRIYKLISKSTAIANEVAVYFSMIAIGNHAQRSITFASDGVAAQTAVLAN